MKTLTSMKNTTFYQDYNIGEIDSYLDLGLKYLLYEASDFAKLLRNELDSPCGSSIKLAKLNQLLEINHNSQGYNPDAAAANLLINAQSNLIFCPKELSQSVCSYLHVFDVEKLIKKCNNYTFKFAEDFFKFGIQFACSNSDMKTCQFPETCNTKITKKATYPILVSCFCLSKDLSPIFRHDHSHVVSGANNSAPGEMLNDLFDVDIHAIGQYGRTANLQEHERVLRLLLAFPWLTEFYHQQQVVVAPVKYVKQYSDICKTFYQRYPQYIDRYGLTSHVDPDTSFMIDAKGKPIIDIRTGNPRIPDIDYTDLKVISLMASEIDNLLSRDNLHKVIDLQTMYQECLRSIDLVSQLLILHENKELYIHENGMFAAVQTFKDLTFECEGGRPSLSKIEGVHRKFISEQDIKDKLEQQMPEHLVGYVVDLGEDFENVWVSSNPPELVFLRDSLQVKRVSFLRQMAEEALQFKIKDATGIFYPRYNNNLFGSQAFLLPVNSVKVVGKL